MIFEGVNDEHQGHIKTMYPGGLECSFTKAADEMLDFFEYLAHDTQEYDNARESLSRSIPNHYVMHTTRLHES